MKQSVFVMGIATIALVFSTVSTIALPRMQRLTDPLGQISKKDWCQYENLKSTSEDLSNVLGWPSAPDLDASPIASNQAGPGVALYAVSGTQTVEVSFYSSWGTFATVDENGYRPGMSSHAARRYPMQIGRNSRQIYLHTPENTWKHLVDDYSDKMFKPLAAPPTEPLEAYGLTVLCSPDNRSFTAVSCTMTRVSRALDAGASLESYYETYRAAVPANTRFIRIELREAAYFQSESSGLLPNSSASMRLADVSFSGTDVSFHSLDGKPSSQSKPQPESQPESQPSSSSSLSSSSETASSSSLASIPAPSSSTSSMLPPSSSEPTFPRPLPNGSDPDLQYPSSLPASEHASTPRTRTTTTRVYIPTPSFYSQPFYYPVPSQVAWQMGPRSSSSDSRSDGLPSSVASELSSVHTPLPPASSTNTDISELVQLYDRQASRQTFMNATFMVVVIVCVLKLSRK